MWEAILYKGVCSGQPSGFLYYNMIIRIKMPPLPPPKPTHGGSLRISVGLNSSNPTKNREIKYLGASEFWRVNSSCSTSGTRRATLVTNTVEIVNMNEKRPLLFLFSIVKLSLFHPAISISHAINAGFHLWTSNWTLERVKHFWVRVRVMW